MGSILGPLTLGNYHLNCSLNPKPLSLGLIKNERWAAKCSTSEVDSRNFDESPSHQLFPSCSYPATEPLSQSRQQFISHDRRVRLLNVQDLIPPALSIQRQVQSIEALRIACFRPRQVKCTSKVPKMRSKKLFQQFAMSPPIAPGSRSEDGRDRSDMPTSEKQHQDPDPSTL